MRNTSKLYDEHEDDPQKNCEANSKFHINLKKQRKETRVFYLYFKQLNQNIAHMCTSYHIFLYLLFVQEINDLKIEYTRLSYLKHDLCPLVILFCCFWSIGTRFIVVIYFIYSIQIGVCYLVCN